MNRVETHYDVLGVAPGATQEAIRQAYRALARLHHPDVSREAGAPDRFGRIAEAYEVLSDVVRRRSYDRSLREGGAPPGSGDAPAAATPHYTWTNIAAAPQGGPDRTELDEMYDAFFAPEESDPRKSA